MWTRRHPETDIKTGGVSIRREESAGEFRMLCRWCPAYSGRDFVPGFFRELREPVITMLREKLQVTELISMRVLMRDTGAELSVVVRKPL
ncbi:MAG: hypothetical protein CSA79_00190 [Thiothrix nivea]|nr:MAG: hypothetical protein CSA79_00190 [Thiothrix nivea]